MRVFYLGTGGSWPTKRRGPMSIGIRLKGTTVLVDCGEGTQRQILFSSISPMKIDAVFITHVHGDHFLGLPGLVQSMSLNDRARELLIFGPPGITSAWEHALDMCPFTQRFPIVVEELRGTGEFLFKDVIVKHSPNDHGLTGLAYRFDERERPGRFNRARALEIGLPEGPLWGKVQKGEEVHFKKGGATISVGPGELLGPSRKGASVVYSGDTRPCSSVVELSKGADLLIHEATFLSELSDLAMEVGHSTIDGAVSVAMEAEVRELALVHSSPRYTKDDRFDIYREEAEKAFPGVMLPEDLDEYEVTL